LIHETNILLLYILCIYVFNILCMYAKSVNGITKLAVSVLAFQQIFHFIKGGLRLCGAPGWNIEKGSFYLYKTVVKREKINKRTAA